MIDIHCHLLFGEDDGPQTLVEYQNMLREAAQQKITDIILTPHFRQGMFPHDIDRIRSGFFQLRKTAEECGVRIFRGTEYHVDSHCVENLRSGRCFTLADSDYVLAEYSGSSEFVYIRNTVQELLLAGYIPVIAHAERYQCLLDDLDLIEELRKGGAMIQINADAVLGKDGRGAKQFCKQLLDYGMADFIASDSHDMTERPCRMAACRDFVRRKYGEETAVWLFETHPARIIEHSGE